MKCLSCFTHTTQEIEQNNTFEIKQWIWIIEIGYSTQPMHWRSFGRKAFLSSICSKTARKSQNHIQNHIRTTPFHTAACEPGSCNLQSWGLLQSPTKITIRSPRARQGGGQGRSEPGIRWFLRIVSPEKSSTNAGFFSHIEVLVYRRLPSGKLT